MLINLFLSLNVYSQYSYYEKSCTNIIPPSEMSRKLEKFSGYPISPSTGLIDISIPLFSINSLGLEITPTIKYHSSGIKITDSDGIVGYGWSMQPNIRIYRTINGKPDEYCPVILPPKIEDMDLNKLLKIAEPQENDLSYNGTEFPDGQYDIYTVSLFNEQVSFYLSYTGNKNKPYIVNLINCSSLIIDPLISESINFPYMIYGFHIKDSNGIDYYFGEKEYDELNVHNSNYIEFTDFSSIPMGWVLNEMKKKSEITTFKYQKTIELPLMFDYSILIDNGIVFENNKYEPSSPDFKKLTDGRSSFCLNLDRKMCPLGISPRQNCVLQQIYTKEYCIIFSFIELDKRKKINSILLYSNEIKNELVKKIAFGYKNDCFLKTLKIDDKQYTFDYEEQDSQFSKSAIDWWGYFNGKTSNKNAVPKLKVEMISTYPKETKDVYLGTADRTPSAFHMKAKSLNKITYPTGGYLKIYYDANRVDNSGKIGPGLRVDSTELFDPITRKKIVSRYTYEEPIFTSPKYPDSKSCVSESGLCSDVLDTSAGVDKVKSLIKVRQIAVNSFPSGLNMCDNNAKVFYKKVTLASGENKTIYKYKIYLDEFTNGVEQSLGEEILYPYLINTYIQKEPLLLSKEQYVKINNSYCLKEEEKNYYKEFNIEKVDQLLCKVKYKLVKLNMFAPYGPNSHLNYLHKITTANYNPKILFNHYSPYCHDILLTNIYSFIKGDVLLVEQNKMSYTDNSQKPIKEIVKYEYDSERLYNIIKKTTVINMRDSLIERSFYPNNPLLHRELFTRDELSSIDDMNKANYKKNIIEKAFFRNSTYLYSTLSSYQCTDPFIYELYKKYTINYNLKPSLLVVYNLYNKQGNLLQLTNKENTPITFLWSYGGRLLIAEIKGSTYEQVCNALGGKAEVERINNCLKLSKTDLYKINSLRMNKDLKFNEIFTYSYKPFIGILSKTNPLGISTYYEYDKSGYLKSIKDNKGKTTHEYSNHYKCISHDD